MDLFVFTFRHLGQLLYINQKGVGRFIPNSIVLFQNCNHILYTSIFWPKAFEKPKQRSMEMVICYWIFLNIFPYISVCLFRNKNRQFCGGSFKWINTAVHSIYCCTFFQLYFQKTSVFRYCCWIIGNCYAYIR